MSATPFQSPLITKGCPFLQRDLYEHLIPHKHKLSPCEQLFKIIKLISSFVVYFTNICKPLWSQGTPLWSQLSPSFQRLPPTPGTLSLPPEPRPNMQKRV